MIEQGKIVITDKVYFELDGSKKPYKPLFTDIRNLSDKKTANNYLLALTKYKASKQLIEVSNVIKKGHWWVLKISSIAIKNNGHCKAKIKDNKATIIKLN